jgi:hypothetical protein
MWLLFEGQSWSMKRRSMRPCQAERYNLLKRALHRRGREQRQGIDCHGSVVLSPVDRILKRAVLGHQADRVIEIAIADFTML